MAVQYSKDSAYAQEARKWEGQYSEYGPPGRPYQFMEFPKRLYKATRPVAGGSIQFDGRDAADENEERNLLSRGYRFGQDKAIEALEKADLYVAEATANRHFMDQRLGAAARAEAEAADNATASHLPEIPEKKRGRPAKKVEIA